jgi:type I restriction enzyme S subunit
VSELPTGWTKCLIGDAVATLRNGFVSPQSKDGVGAPVTRIETISQGFIDSSRLGYVAVREPKVLDPYRLEAGDILFSHINSPSHLGKTAIYEGEPKRLYHGMNLLLVRATLGVAEPRFLEHVLQFLRSTGLFALHAQHAVNQASINRKKLASFEFLLAPLNEQKRIADKLDAVLARVDACRERLDRIPAILKRFRQSVLAAATSGQLTEEWREENHTKENSKPSTLYELHEEPPFELPTNWIWIKWKDIVTKDKYSFKRGPFGSALRKEFFVSDGYKVYEQCCPINDDCSLGKYYITEEKFKELEAFQVNAGDLLISCSGVTLGRITQVPVNFQLGIINQALLKLTLDTTLIDPVFFIKFFRSQLFQRLIFENAQGSAIPNIKGVKELKELPVPLPPLFEQHEIVRRVASLFAYADRLEAHYAAARAQVERLTPALLAKAFRGELVPQDPHDEPASVLLKRICALGVGRNKRSISGNQEYQDRRERPVAPSTTRKDS